MLPRYVKDGAEVRLFFTNMIRANRGTLLQSPP